MPNLDSVANGGGAESSAESPEVEERQAVQKSCPAALATKGRGLRRWRRIRREQQTESHTAANSASGGGAGASRGDEDSAQLHKRRIPLPADAPKPKHLEAASVEDESSTASVESRFTPQAPATRDQGLGGFLPASAGFAIGADSDHSESSTAASAPRALLPRSRASPHGKHPRAARPRADRLRAHAGAGSTEEAEDSRSSVDSDTRSSNATKPSPHLVVGDTGNGVDSGLSASGDSCREPSEDARPTAAGGYCEENGSSVSGTSAAASAGSDDGGVKDTVDEGSVRNGQDGGLHPGADPYDESVSLLQRTQEALENEVDKIEAVGKVRSDEFDIYDDEGSGSVHLEEPIEAESEVINHHEFRLEEACALIKEKDSKILELGALRRMQPGKTATESAVLLLSQSELEGLYQEKVEAEIRCLILKKAYQTLATLADDQMAPYQAQKSLSEDYKQLGLKLRHAEHRAMSLEEKAEKLQVRCKELSWSSEVLQLQSKASRVSLFCFLQFMLLCVAVGTYLMRLVPSSSTEVVPT